MAPHDSLISDVTAVMIAARSGQVRKSRPREGLLVNWGLGGFGRATGIFHAKAAETEASLSRTMISAEIPREPMHRRVRDVVSTVGRGSAAPSRAARI